MNGLTDIKYKRAGHFIRWALELALIWLFVLSETGFWTCATMTIITVGIEFDHLNPRDWAKI